RPPSLTDHLLQIYGPSGTGDLSSNGQQTAFSTLFVKYDNPNRRWKILKKFDVYGDVMTFLDEALPFVTAPSSLTTRQPTQPRQPMQPMQPMQPIQPMQPMQLMLPNVTNATANRSDN